MKRLIPMVLAGFVVWLAVGPAWATTYFVATTGNDSNDGLTAGTPFRNPQRCISFVVAGDTCTVADGTYTDVENKGVTVYINRAAGTPGNPITLKSTNRYGAKILVNGITVGNNAANLGFHITKSYFIIDGFEITGGTGNSNNSSLSYAGADVTDGVTGTIIRNNKIHDIGRAVCSTSPLGFAGVYLLNAIGTVVESNLIYSIGRLRVRENGCAASVHGDINDHGLYVHGGSITIRNNVIFDSNRGWPIQFSSGGVDRISRIDMYHNTIDGQSPTGSPAGQVELSSAITSGVIANNIFSDALGSVFRIGGTFSTSGLTYDYNLTDNTDANMVFEPALPSNLINGGHNRTSTNPGFINSGAHDYHLVSGSAAINAGLTLSSVTVDKDGITRPQGAGYDIGAYELSGSPTDTTPPATPTNIRMEE